MGTLKPGATYVYERDGTTVYAREHGANPNERKVVGWDLDSRLQDLMDNVLWSNIRQAAQTNPVLQEMLDRVVILYRLSDKNPK
jgi:hypothetical protein